MSQGKNNGTEISTDEYIKKFKESLEQYNIAKLISNLSYEENKTDQSVLYKEYKKKIECYYDNTSKLLCIIGNKMAIAQNADEKKKIFDDANNIILNVGDDDIKEILEKATNAVWENKEGRKKYADIDTGKKILCGILYVFLYFPGYFLKKYFEKEKIKEHILAQTNNKDYLDKIRNNRQTLGLVYHMLSNNLQAYYKESLEGTVSADVAKQEISNLNSEIKDNLKELNNKISQLNLNSQNKKGQQNSVV